MAERILFKNSTLIFIGIFALALIIILAAVYWALEIRKVETMPSSSSPPAGVITIQEIQEALLKKSESTEIKTLSEKQINQALNKKIPVAKRPKALTPEEIKKALEAK